MNINKNVLSAIGGAIVGLVTGYIIGKHEPEPIMEESSGDDGDLTEDDLFDDEKVNEVI